MPRLAQTGHRRDADVRKLLRLLRRPHLLEKDQLAILLRQAVRTQTAREALLALIEQTFGSGYEGQRLHEIVQRCDVRGEKARTSAAAMHVSLRQFFRYRVEAIAALASAIYTRLNDGRAPDHDLAFANMLSAVDVDSAAEIYASSLRAGPYQPLAATQEDILRCAIWAGKPMEELDRLVADARLSTFALVERAGLALLTKPGLARDMFARAKAALADSEGSAQERTLFALTCYELLAARIEGNLGQASSLSAQLRSLSGSSESLHALALAEQGYQACLVGTPSQAEALVADAEKLTMLAPCLQVSARIALTKATALYLGGNHADALVYANAAVTALSGTQPAHAFLAAALAGRAALSLGRVWNPPERLCDRFPDANLRADVESVRSRHLLQKDVNAARRAALHGLHLAEQHGARGSIAYARASLAAVAEAQHRNSEARLLRSQAWQEAVSLGDHLLLYDSFTSPVTLVQQIPPITA